LPLPTSLILLPPSLPPSLSLSLSLTSPGIVKHIDGLNTEQIQKIGIPNGIPLVYKFDKNMKPIVQSKAVAPLSGEYLEKKVRTVQYGMVRYGMVRYGTVQYSTVRCMRVCGIKVSYNEVM
jgi:hypothetical protein